MHACAWCVRAWCMRVCVLRACALLALVGQRHCSGVRGRALVSSPPTSWAPNPTKQPALPRPGRSPFARPGSQPRRVQPGEGGGESAERPPEGLRRGKAGTWRADLECRARAQTRARSFTDRACPAAHTPPQRSAARTSPAPSLAPAPPALQLVWALSRQDAGGPGVGRSSRGEQ